MIKILFLAANPLDTDRLRLDDEVRAIDEALLKADFRNHFELYSHWAVRVEDLQELLLRYKPDIVHFSGHGNSMPVVGQRASSPSDSTGTDRNLELVSIEGETIQLRSSQIVLQDASGKSAPVPPHALSTLFRVLKDNIRCVVLNACYSQAQAEGIAEHIDCVIGMSSAISDVTAIVFATAFYRGLGYGRSIQLAFDLGCSQIDLNTLSGSLIPQLIAHRTSADKLVLATNEEFTQSEAAIEQAPGESPYKGLQYFDTADATLFFGRERLTAELVDYLRTHRFLAVVGASGSGKSSLVRAGVVPALQHSEPLQNGILPPEGSVRWRYCIITPTAHPLEELAAKLTQDSESVTATTIFLDDLRKDNRSLHLFVRRLVASDNRLLLVVDQFEELFTLCRDANERKAFVDNLLTAAVDDGVTTIVITLRADFYAHCFAFDNLRTALEGYQRNIGIMNLDELRQAIEKPAQQGGWEFEPGLVDLLLHDVDNESGALPLLSHALLETWKRRRGRMLTLAGYVESGRVQGAIAQTAEWVLTKVLTPEQQAIAKNIFLRLTELGEGAEDTRRRVQLTELMPQSKTKPSVETVLKTLADARLVTTDKDKAEVAHEALIRSWPTLRRWLDENREGLRIHRRLTEDAQGWEALKRDSGELYRGLRLQQVQVWVIERDEELNELEQAFLNASLAERQYEIEVQERIQSEREEARQRDLENAQALAAAAEEKQQTEAARAQEAEARQQIEQQRAIDAELAASRLRTRALYLGVALSAAILAIVATTYFYLESTQNALRAAQNAVEVENNARAAARNAMEAESNAQLAQARLAQMGKIVSSLGTNQLIAISEDLVQSGDRDGALLLLQTAFGSNPDLVSDVPVDGLENDTVALVVSAIDGAQKNLTQSGNTIATQALLDWMRHFAYKDRTGAVYFYVPTGEFLMGSGVGDIDEESPQHTVILDGYWIQSTEVTKAQYRQCMEEGSCNKPADSQLNNATYANYPVVNVNWVQASTYAAWVGGRLPTEAEWEKACRGTDAATYPWGDESPTAELANFDNIMGATTEVGTYPEGVSPYGLYDMAGNVLEWTSDWYDENYYIVSPDHNPTGPGWGKERALRGGLIYSTAYKVRCAQRSSEQPSSVDSSYGFRVVVSSSTP